MTHDEALALSAELAKREWFAGMALASLSAELKHNEEYGAAMRALASKAFVIADAMLAESQNGGEG